jgi:uncharacterized protein (TIGR03437 family)
MLALPTHMVPTSLPDRLPSIGFASSPLALFANFVGTIQSLGSPPGQSSYLKCFFQPAIRGWEDIPMTKLLTTKHGVISVCGRPLAYAHGSVAEPRASSESGCTNTYDAVSKNADSSALLATRDYQLSAGPPQLLRLPGVFIGKFRSVRSLEPVVPKPSDTQVAACYNFGHENWRLFSTKVSSFLAKLTRVTMAKHVDCILIAVLGLTSSAPIWAQATLVPLLPSAAPGLATAPGTVTIKAQPSQQVNGKGTVTVTLPGSLPFTPCPKDAGVSQCLGPATAHITHTLSGFDSYLISITQAGLTPQKVGNSTIQQCDDRDYANNFTPRTSFDCHFDWLPYFSGSFATYSTDIKVDITTTGNFTNINYPVDFQWGPPSPVCTPSAAAAASRSGYSPLLDNAACTDEIKITLSLPSPPNNPVAAIAEQLPAFCASGKYSLTQSGDRKANIFLIVVDEKDRTLAKSENLMVFPPGKDIEWGRGCSAAKDSDLIFTKEVGFDKLRQDLLWPYDNASLFKEPADKVLSTLRVYAGIADAVTGAPIARSAPVVYNIVPGGRLTNWKLRVTGSSKDTIVPDSVVLPGSALFDDSRGNKVFGTDFRTALALASGLNGFDVFLVKAAYLDAEVEFPGDSGNFSADFHGFSSSGSAVAAPLTAIPQPIVKGTNKVSLKIVGNMPAGISQLQVAPKIELPAGQTIYLPQFTMPVNNLTIAHIMPDNRLCGPDNMDQCFKVNAPNDIAVQLESDPATHVALISARGVVEVAGSRPRDAFNHTVATNPPQGPPATFFEDKFRLDPLDDPKTVAFRLVYSFQNCAASPTESCGGVSEAYRQFLSKDVAVGGGITDTAAQIAGGALRGIKSNTKTVINAIRSQGAGIAQSKLDKLLGNRPSPKSVNQKNAQSADPDLLWLNGTWRFAPAIPRDGSFSATLALSYSHDMFPDDPSFREDKLQIVSLDASGGLHLYPTTVNMTIGEATAQIDSLDPYYGLAMPGPFSNTPLMMASAASGYAVVNAGSQPATLQIANLTTDGQGALAPTTLKSLNMRTDISDGAVKAFSDSESVAYASWQEAGKLLSVAPASKPDQTMLLPGVEYTSKKTVEIQLANPSPADTEITATLFNADGSMQGTYGTTLVAGSSVRAPVHTLFPNLAQGFRGYLIVGSQLPIVAGGVIRTALATGSIVAQPLNSSTISVTTRYALLVADNSVSGTIHLVNSGKAATQVTLRGRAANGTAAGQDVKMPLAAGQQYTGDVATLFGGLPVASVTLISNSPGVFGDLVSADASFQSQYVTSIPFTDQPGANAVLPYATSTTVVPVFNPGTAAATVTVTPYSTNGSAGVPATTTVAAGARALVAISSSGFVMVRSTQPVFAAGLVTTAAGGMTGYPAASIVAAASGGDGGGPVPASSAAGVVNAASYKNGGVAPGEIVTIFGSNEGPATLAMLTLDSSGRVANTLSGARVYFDGVPSPLIYTVSGQESVIVPYSVAGKASTQMVLEYQGRQSSAIALPVVAAAPALFSSNSSGSGQGAILNQDFSTNGPQKPAAAGSAIILYGTGEGAVTPAVPDGTVNATVFPQPVLKPVTATIGGLPAAVLYAGAAGNLVAGVFQVNLLVPNGLAGGNQPVVVNVGGFSTQAGLTVAIAGGGGKLTLSAASLAFGNVSVGQSKDLQITVSNTGTAGLGISSVVLGGSSFSLTTSIGALTLQPGASFPLTVRFAPTAATSSTGTLTITSNDSVSPAVVALSGTGTGTAPVPNLMFTPARLDFGNVTVGKPQSLSVNLTNSGTAGLLISSISTDSAMFIPGANAVTIGAGASLALTVQFAPLSAGTQSGTLKLATNDPAHATVALPLTGTGVAGTTSSITLSVDGGTFNGALGLPGADTAVFVNRLTPPSYPSTLTAIQIYFGNRTNGLALNAPITLIAATNPGGLSSFSTASAGEIHYYPTKVAALGSFITYTLSPPVTLTSGDFVVGFLTSNPNGVFPADIDQQSGSKGRSYVSSDGLTFAKTDSLGPSLAGNFGIRANVNIVGSGGNVPSSNAQVVVQVVEEEGAKRMR